MYPPEPASREVRVVVSSGTPLLALGIGAALSEAGLHVAVTLGRIGAYQNGDGDLRVVADELITPETIGRISAEGCRGPILVLTRECSPALEAALIRAGASCVLELSCAPSQMAEVAMELLEGRPRVRIEAIRLLTQSGVEALFTLRQREILRLVADGHPVPEIARRLGVSPSTVKTHLARLGARLGTAGRSELILAAQFLLVPLGA